MDHDLIVVGGGAGGLSAARTGARRGARTVLVQDGPLGGDCTFTGCVPSKTLIEAARRGDGFGAAMAAVRAAVGQIAATEDDAALRRDGIEVRHGRARLLGGGRVEVDGRTLAAPRIVLATGARPQVPPVEGLADADHLTSDTVWDLERLPASLVVLGGGSIGCELAGAFAGFGCRTSVVEAVDRLLPGEEPEASQVVAAALEAAGVAVRTGRPVEAVAAADGGVALRLQGGTTVEAERLLVAVGREPVTDGLGLDAAGVRTEAGRIVTDDGLATSAPGVWAVGDVTGRMPFTHAADEMGRIAVANALSRLARVRPRRFRREAVPWVTFTTPEVGRVGLTEAAAAEAHRGARVAYLPMAEVDRAVAAGRTEGFVKLIAGPRRVLGDLGGGRVLGATVVAPRGGELVHEAALAMRTGMFTGRLAQTVHAYPTWSVAVQQAAAQFFVEVGGRRARPARRTG